MREILFRAKRKDNGEWTEGYVFELQPGQYMICDRIQYDRPSTLPVWEFFRYCSHEIDPETLCQYTGLKDKNGNRIWENDIVKCNKRKDGFELYKVLWRKYYADFGVEPLDFGVQYPISLGENEQDIKGCNYEIIGNIFDNPELLKGGLTCRN